MGITSFILKFAAPIPHMEHYDHYLFIGPHPDDIEIGAGGTVAKLTSMGKQVSFLICLDGRFGLEHAPEGTTPEALSRIRKQECMDAAKVLGVSDVRFLNLSDGGLYAKEALFDGIAKMVGEIKPEVLFAPDPDTGSECHQDHLNVGNAVKQLAFFAPFEEIMRAHEAETAPVKALALYMTAKPNRYVSVNKRLLQKQQEAILCHKSQYPKDSADLHSLYTYLKLRSVDFGIRSFHGRAEGFRVLGRTHMHCLPEAGK